MPRPGAEIAAAHLAARLRAALGHDRLQVRPHGVHLLVELLDDDGADTIARLTAITSATYTAGFRNHARRWEPLPISGPLDTAADELVDVLRPFLEDNKIT